MYQGTYIALICAKPSYALITQIRIRKTLNMHASKRSIYGAKQVRRVWNRTISNVQKQLGYDSIEVDSRLFVKKIMGMFPISWAFDQFRRHEGQGLFSATRVQQALDKHWNLLEGKWVQITLLGHDHAWKCVEAIIVVKLKITRP